MTGKVLIVDDEDALRYALEDWLDLAGYHVFHASNGNEGLSLLRQLQPDLVISDVWMPGIDGYEFCRLARRACDAALFMITGVPQEAAVLKEMNVDVDAYLVKPLHMKEFLELVESIFSRRRNDKLLGRSSRSPRPGSK